MPTFDATTARCSVIAYKEGLLSAVGHNVRLEVGRFEVVLELARLCHLKAKCDLSFSLVLPLL